MTKAKITTNNRSFLGTGWSFPPHFNKTLSGVEMVSNEEDINQSLHILLSTNLGERLMIPTYGCDIKNFQFEPITTNLKTQIKDLVETAILHFETRVNLINLEVSSSSEQDGLLQINISYEIKTTNSRFNFVYPFYLKEGYSK